MIERRGKEEGEKKTTERLERCVCACVCTHSHVHGLTAATSSLPPVSSDSKATPPLTQPALRHVALVCLPPNWTLPAPGLDPGHAPFER